jgi:hypothetical protein
MARIDKYDSVDGGFRAPLAAAWAGQAAPLAVSLDGSGRVVIGAGTALTQVGVICKPNAAAAGEFVDIMTDGELVEAGLVAGTVYYANATTGALETSAPGAGVNKFRVGHTVEASRLVVRCQVVQG